MTEHNLYGLKMPQVEEEFCVVDALVVVKGYIVSDDPDAPMKLQYREIATAGLTPVECYGMAMSCADSWRDYLSNRAQQG
jgi:hypothetical protein